MDTTSLTVPIETARHVLWRYDRTGGTEPGPFTKHLMAAIAHADVRHRAILREAFPELSEALRIAHSDEDGLAKLQDIARGAANWPLRGGHDEACAYAGGISPNCTCNKWPIRCTRCKDEDGPFTDDRLCEACARPMPLDGVA
ncbi:hypothetical protein ACFWIO_35040 [Streptomyces diastatochromogenes]|uniref:hypothetical protein n=1 Tax=Streptomyces diastatochromogenes TaxID=42236 RepID=UPI00366535D8